MRVSTSALSNGGVLALESRIVVARQDSYRDFPEGARTSFEASTSIGAREATAEGEKLSPSGPAVEAALLEFAKSTRELHHGCGSARRIHAAEDPRVAMIAKQHPFVRQLATANTRFDDRVRLHTRVHVHFYVNFHCTAETIRDGQTAPPILRRFRAVHIFEKRPGIAPRERERGNFRQRARFFRSNMSCARDRGPSGRGGIAGNNVVVSDRAALNVTLRAPRTIGKNFAACGTIFSGIGINEQRRSAFPLGSERLEATIAVRIRVADEYDLPSHTDAVFPEEIVIFRIAAVRVDDFGGDVAGSGIAEEGAGDGGIFRVRIDVVSIFTQRGGEGDRLRHFQGNAARARVQNVVTAKCDV